MFIFLEKLILWYDKKKYQQLIIIVFTGIYTVTKRESPLKILYTAWYRELKKHYKINR